jgi:hypothetical protein
VIRRAFLVFIVGLGIGALGGTIYGWVSPLNEVTAGIDKLHPAYKEEYVVMVGAAYAQDGDWDLAQARLGKLGEPDIARYIVVLTEIYIDDSRNVDDIRNLVRLAARFGYTTTPMQPYLQMEQPES